jgi:hypothetical protein
VVYLVRESCIKIMDHRIGNAVAFAGSLVHKAAQRHTLGRALGIAGGFLLDRYRNVAYAHAGH